MSILQSAGAWLVAGITTCVLVACGGGGAGYNMNGSSAGDATSATSYAATNVVSDAGATPYVDANLINAWGIAFNPQGFVWIANHGTSTSTLYDGNGVPQSLVVSIPPGRAGNAEPTGVVFNGSADFMVSQGGVSGPSVFIFVGEAGTVAGWSPGVNRNSAVTVLDNGAAGAVYKGAAISMQGASHLLYAPDFHNGRVDVFDAGFKKVAAAGGFADPTLPVGYAPFGIQAVGDRIYVSYAKQDAQAHDEVAGAGLGVVDVFDTSGKLIKQLVPAGGALNAPWGLAIAPADFGPFSNALLVGNFGDGRINAFDPATGAMLGTLSKADGMALVIDGLRGIAFGNGLNSQPSNTLFFTAGPGAGAHGAYGRIYKQ